MCGRQGRGAQVTDVVVLYAVPTSLGTMERPVAKPARAAVRVRGGANCSGDGGSGDDRLRAHAGPARSGHTELTAAARAKKVVRDETVWVRRRRLDTCRAQLSRDVWRGTIG